MQPMEMKMLRKQIQKERKAKARQLSRKEKPVGHGVVDKDEMSRIQDIEHAEMQEVQIQHAVDPYEMTVWMCSTPSSVLTEADLTREVYNIAANAVEINIACNPPATPPQLQMAPRLGGIGRGKALGKDPATPPQLQMAPRLCGIGRGKALGKDSSQGKRPVQ